MLQYNNIIYVKTGGKMKEKLAEKIKKIALKAARKSVGKSFPMGMYDPEIPQELINEIRREKK